MNNGDLEKLLAWDRILSSPVFLKCMDNARETRGRIAYEILTGKSAPIDSEKEAS